MKKINYIFNLKIITIICVVLLFSQFIAIVLSNYINNFLLLIIFSILIATIISFLICPECKIYIPRKSFFIILTSSIFVTLVLALRINWGIFDLICPTSILGMTSQTSLGNFPPSFLATPDLIANYHFGFIFIAGSISYIFSLAPIYSIYFSILLIFFLNIALMCFILYSKYNSLKNVFLFICLILFTASFPTIYLIKNINNFVSWYTYLNVIEYFSSTSWLLGFLSIGILTYFFTTQKDTGHVALTNFYFISKVYLVILSTSTANAAIYSITMQSFTLMVLIAYLISSREILLNENKFFNKSMLLNIYSPLIIFTTIVLISFIIPKLIPSAFNIGLDYEQVDINLRILANYSLHGLKVTFHSILKYFILCGPIVFVGLLISFFYIKHKLYLKNINSVENFYLLTFLISFIFPLIFSFNNIDEWDNFHKFAYVSMYISILIISFYNLKNNFKKNIKLAIVLSLLIMIPINLNLILTRMKALPSGTHFDDYSEIETFLINKYKKDNRKILLYPAFNPQKCGSDALMVSKAGCFLKGVYFDNFLLARKIENKIANDLYWYTDQQRIFEIINAMKDNEFILLENSNQREIFIKKIPTNILAKLKFIKFEHYTLIQRN